MAVSNLMLVSRQTMESFMFFLLAELSIANSIDVYLYISGTVEESGVLDYRKMPIYCVRKVSSITFESILHVGDSPEGLVGILTEEGDSICDSCEIKTITSPKTINVAETVRDIFVQDIRIARDTDEVFRKHSQSPTTGWDASHSMHRSL